MAHTHENKLNVSEGVTALIEQLRQEGIEKGEIQANDIVAKAQAKADAIIKAAEAKAAQQLTQARKESEALKTSTEEALRTAMRDIVLRLKTELSDNFKADLTRMIETELSKPALIKDLIVEIAAKVKTQLAIDEQTKITFLLPENAPNMKALIEDSEQLTQGPINAMVFGLTKDMLIDGVQFGLTDDIRTGFKLKLNDRNIEVDFTDEAITKTLLAHLQPRFRALLEGVIK